MFPERFPSAKRLIMALYRVVCPRSIFHMLDEGTPGEFAIESLNVDDEDDDDGAEFEDAAIPEPTIQTVEVGSDKDKMTRDEYLGFEDIKD